MLRRLRLRAAEAWLPPPLVRRGMRDLFAVAAAAFDRPAPDLGALDPSAARAALALFTREGARTAAADPAARAEATRRLREGGVRLGADLGRRLGVRTRADAMRAARVLYRAIGIDFRGTASGEANFAACAFSSAYDPEACGIMSALDEGILAGLSGGGRLAFSARITEGAPACRARFIFDDGAP